MKTRCLASSLRACALVIIGLLLAACSTSETLRPLPASTYLREAGYSALVVDGNTGSILMQEHADAPRYPASLTKMMTLYMLFEAIDSGQLSRAALMPVSAQAASQPPSRLGLRAGDVIDVETAIRALATKSANDVAVVVAEQLAGSEDAFARMMTMRARQLGMGSTVFRNASGLPDPGQQTSARDMARLGMLLRKRFPHYYGYFSAREFAFRGKTIRGHYDLLGRVRGVDGIKTGYIRASGYNVVTSVSDGGRWLVVVVMGGQSAKSRDAYVEQLITHHMRRASRNGR